MSKAPKALMGLIVLSAALVAFSGAVLAKTELFIRGAKVTKQADGSWSGRGKLAGVSGDVTITGQVELLKTKRHKIQWSWKSGNQQVAGCSVNQVLTRPHGIQLWDGSGRVRKTSSKYRKYKGLPVNLYGPTKKSDLNHATISIRSYKPTKQFPAVRC
jgi:hypothetical protein